LIHVLVVERKFCETVPDIWGGSASDLEDFLKLVAIVGTSKKRLSVDNLSEDASDRPNVHRSRVILGTKQNIRSSVPKGYDFVSEILDRDSKGSGQAEICQL